MEELQIYDVVNDLAKQSLGSIAIKVTSTQGLVALGNTILESDTHTSDFLNTLARRIGKVIISARAYRSQFNGLVKDKFEWGSIVQKIKVGMPIAETDESYGLLDGGTVDHYVISLPKVEENALFLTDTPYQFKITIQRVHLKTAFLSAEGMGAFLDAIFTEMTNAIELSLENLGRVTLSNFMAEVSGARVVNLVTEYNAIVDTSKQVTSATALVDESFLRYAIGRMKLISKRMRGMTTQFNNGTATRHTPLEMQKLYVLADFETALETQVEYMAFNRQYVDLGTFEEVSYWQAIKSPSSIDIARASDNSRVQLSNIVGALFDKDALGMYNEEHITSTTPMNSAGLYYNQYHHLKQMWFNDLSENFVMFTLN